LSLETFNTLILLNCGNFI